uniref:Uncharacterized protein n=1 Tax=viral metagenome TaxID=1070528 RepID=A0A6M3IGC3_9ZZZZ
MAKTTTNRSLWCWATADGVAPNRVTGRIAASQGILIPGAPMYRDGAGTWKLRVTTAATSDRIHGLLAGVVNAATTWPLAAELAVNTEVYIDLVDEADTYACFVNANAADTYATDALIGNDYGLDVSSSTGYIGHTTMNTGDTTNVVVEVVDILSRVEPSKNATTDSPGIALIKFKAAATASV